MGKLDGRVALITGGARGQGLSHALTLAREGADIVLLDVPGPLPSVPYATAGEADLESAVSAVEELDRPCVGVKGDARDPEQVARAVDTAIERFGKLDIVLCNHGIASFHEITDMSDAVWQEMIDVNLTGPFNVARAVIPHMRERQYGRIVFTASGLARQGMQMQAHYISAKWGVLGLMKSLALEVATDGITVNAVLPTTVYTPMIRHEAMYRLFRPDLENPGEDDMKPLLIQMNAQGIPWVQPQAISNCILFLVSDDAANMTGGGLDVGAGWNARGSS